MDYLLTAAKTAAVLAIMVLVFIGLPILGATGSLSRAWQALREYLGAMAWLVLPGVLVGLIVAFTA